MLNRLKTTYLGAVIIVNGALWLIPSNMVERVARDRHLFLARYSKIHFVGILAALIVSLIGLSIAWAKPDQRKRRCFQVACGVLAIMLSSVLGDLALRTVQPTGYITDESPFHRPRHQTYRGTQDDHPKGHLRLDEVAVGYPRLEWTLRTDKRGYRNSTDLDKCEIVAVGDSFTEGYKVSDEQTWPAQLAHKCGLTVYNLGMAAYGPPHYLAALEKHGVSLGAKVFVCMLYEGNDFSSNAVNPAPIRPLLRDRVSLYLTQSPLRSYAERFLDEVLGSIGTSWPIDGLDILSWLPLWIPEGTDAKAYWFGPEEMLALRESGESFAGRDSWRSVADLLEKMQGVSDQAGAALVLAYAPVKARVVWPLVQDRLPPDKVRAVGALCDQRLPAPEQFMVQLCDGVTARPAVVREWCNQRGVLFVNLAEGLRAAAASGRQVYFTFDQHWTPDGYEVAAQVIYEALRREFPELCPVDGSVD